MADAAPLNRMAEPISNPKKLQEYDLLVERDGEICQWCGRGPTPEVPLTIDHIVPDGGEALENKQLLCLPCNSQKGKSTDDKTVRWASSLWQQGFTMVPNVVLTSERISVYAHRIYGLLLYYARQSDACWPGQQGLAQMAPCSDRQVREALKELENVGLVRTRRRGRGETNVYILLVPRSARGAGLDSREEPGAALDRQEVPIKNTQLKKTHHGSGSGARAREVRKWPSVPNEVDWVPVIDEEAELAASVLDAFNAVFGKRFTSKEYGRAIVGRIREHPELTIEQHRELMVKAKEQNPWWERSDDPNPTPAVIYGNSRIFERTLNFEPRAGKKGPDLSMYRGRDPDEELDEEDGGGD